MALNALRTEMVTFTGTPGIEVNGVIVGYRAEYTPRTSTEAKYHAIEGRTSDVASDANHKGQYYIQLGEQLYDGKLRLNNDATDVFGRPSRYWEFNGKEIGTYMKKELVRAEYTKKVTGDTLYDLLTRNTVINYDVEVFIDGEITAPTGATASWWFTKTAINRNNDAAVGGTGNGVLTQVFVNDDDKVVTIAIINTYLAIASDDYNAKKEEAPFNVYGIGKTGTGNIYFKQVRDANDDGKPMIANVEDFNVADIKKDDAVLVTVADSEIQTLVSAEVLAGTKIQSFETGSNSNNNGVSYNPDKPGNVVVDGAQYDFATTAEYDYEVMQYYTTVNGTVNLKDKTYNVYLDRYGYAIGVKELEAAKNYVFITAVDTNNSNRYTRSADASAIFLDGTMADIKIDMTKSSWQTIKYDHRDSVLNTWCTYTVNSNDVYTVKEVSNVTAGGATYVPKGTNNEGGNGKLAQYQATIAETGVGTPNHDVIKIDRKNITVPGIGTAGNTYTRVYGTDKSVYLTVELSELKNTKVYGIIGDVVSATTGVDNVALEAWNTTDVLSNGEDKTVETAVTPDGDKTNDLATSANEGGALANIARISNGVYTLYNDKGDVIAAVVVGEDSGATKNLVYTHTGATFKESYDEATGKWTWQRKVVFNGEEIILTEVGDGLSELGRMKKSTWYQVKYNGDGNVIDVTEYDQVSSMTAGEDYVTSYSNDEILTAVNKKDTVLFHSVTEKVNTNNLKLEERTLWLDGLKTKGFRVADGVKIVLIQNNHNVENTYFESGISSLRSIISDLNDRHTGKAHNYVISAILDRNAATSLIIRDIDDTGAVNCDPYTDPNWGSNNSQVKWIDTSDVTAPVYDGNSATPGTEDIYQMLLGLGYTNVSFVAGDGWTYTSPNGLTYSKVNIVPAGQVKVMINGKTHNVTKGSTFDVDDSTKLGATWSAAAHGNHFKMTNADGSSFVARTDTPTINKDTTFEIGYYKIGVSSTMTTNAGNADGGSITISGTGVLPAGGTYAKKAAGTATLNVTVTNNKPTINGGVKFAANNSATVTGAIAGGATTANLTVSISTAALSDDVTIALDDQDQAQTIQIFVNGTPKTVEVGKKLKDVVESFPEDADSYVLVQTLAYGDTAGTVTEANATDVMDGNSTFASGDANKNFGNVEYVEVDVTGTVTGFTAGVDAYTYDKGTDTNKALFAVATKRYAPIGATIKMTLTCSATQSAADTRTGVGTQFSLTSANAQDKLKYNGTSTVLTTTETAHAITSTVPDNDGTAYDVISQNETVTVTFHTATATGTEYTPSIITPDAYADA